jgi:hypothetical protein
MKNTTKKKKYIRLVIQTLFTTLLNTKKKLTIVGTCGFFFGVLSPSLETLDFVITVLVKHNLSTLYMMI